MTDVETDDPESCPLLLNPEEASTSSNHAKKLKENNAQVGEVLGIMWSNWKDLVQRGEKISDVEEKAGALNFGAEKFKENADKLKRKEWLKNMRYTIILIVITLIIIVLLATAIYEITKNDG